MKKLGIVLSLLLTIGFIPAYADEEETPVTANAAMAQENATMDDAADIDNAAVEENAETPTEENAEVEPQAKEEADPVAVQSKVAVNFGDFKSSTLTTKAWGALAKGDVEAVLAYTNKAIELYGEQARKMEADLKDYVSGNNDEVFKKWALNDVATSYYIQGEAYRKAKMKDEAKEAYNKVINNYTYGQAWDPKGWFWKPAEAAQKKLGEMDNA